jgi:hypothetical protein
MTDRDEKPTDDEADDEFARFEKLTKGLLTVTKKDLDEARSNEKAPKDA